MDPARDLADIAHLLEVTFAEELAGGGRAILRDLYMLSHMGPLLWVITRSVPLLNELFSGFVWEEDGRIVGNTTVSRIRGRSTWVISNVAVLPAYRRRGIARRLMEAALEHVRARGGHTVVLQVRHDNEPARHLYRSLGFHTVGAVHELQATAVRDPLWPIPPEITVRPPDPHRWREARHMALEALPQAIHLFQPIRSAEFRSPPMPGLAEWARYVLLGYRRQQWWAEHQGRLVGILTAERHRDARPSAFELILHPGSHVSATTALLRRGLHFLRGRHPVRVQVPDEYRRAVYLLRQAGFAELRLLDTMVLEL